MKVILYIFWTFFIFAVCLITLPFHVLVWMFLKYNSFEDMITYLDYLTLKMFGE